MHPSPVTTAFGTVFIVAAAVPSADPNRFFSVGIPHPPMPVPVSPLFCHMGYDYTLIKILVFDHYFSPLLMTSKNLFSAYLFNTTGTTNTTSPENLSENTHGDQ
jgi:hypothetical protein